MGDSKFEIMIRFFNSQTPEFKGLFHILKKVLIVLFSTLSHLGIQHLLHGLLEIGFRVQEELPGDHHRLTSHQPA